MFGWGVDLGKVVVIACIEDNFVLADHVIIVIQKNVVQSFISPVHTGSVANVLEVKVIVLVHVLLVKQRPQSVKI